MVEHLSGSSWRNLQRWMEQTPPFTTALPTIPSGGGLDVVGTHGALARVITMPRSAARADQFVEEGRRQWRTAMAGVMRFPAQPRQGCRRPGDWLACNVACKQLMCGDRTGTGRMKRRAHEQAPPQSVLCWLSCGNQRITCTATLACSSIESIYGEAAMYHADAAKSLRRRIDIVR
jgi:hypothetical protein